MNNAMKLGIVVLVLTGLAAVAVLKAQRPPPAVATSAPLAPAVASVADSAQTVPSVPAAVAPAALPRLVDVGAGKCIPCKLMAPILAELRQEYAGRLRVDFVDVWIDPAAAEPYGVSAIPTQIFYAADGKELARHEGFLGKADILAQWQALGVTFAPPAAVPTTSVPPVSTTTVGAAEAAAVPSPRPCCAQ